MHFYLDHHTWHAVLPGIMQQIALLIGSIRLCIKTDAYILCVAVAGDPNMYPLLTFAFMILDSDSTTRGECTMLLTELFAIVEDCG